MALARYKLVIAYDGTAYSGWQRQPDPVPTVQRVVERAFGQIVNHPVIVHGSSRTDAGVHALGQVAHADADTHIEPERLRRAINSRLPGDVDIRSVEILPNFDASSAVRKRYRYVIWRSRQRPLFYRNYVYECRFHTEVSAMQAACELFLGTHDFIAFRGRLDERQTTVRTIFHCAIHRRGPFIIFSVEGSGFLYHMVRNMVGTVLAVGRGHMTPENIPVIIASRDRALAGQCMPASGLCLQWIRFDEAQDAAVPAG